MDYAEIKEWIAESAHDVPVPETKAHLFGWMIRFLYRLWDTPVVREWQLTQRELLASGVFANTYNKEYEYAVAAKVGRNVYSVRRSLERTRKLHSGSAIRVPVPASQPKPDRFNSGRLNRH